MAAQTVKTPHLNLAQFDLDWGHQVLWKKVVEEWKQEQLERASWRIREKRQRQLEQQCEHIRVTRDQQQRTKTWTSSTPSTPSSRTAPSTSQISPPRTPVTLTAPQCIKQLSNLIPPTSFRTCRTHRTHIAELARLNCLMGSPLTVGRTTSTSPSPTNRDESSTLISYNSSCHHGNQPHGDWPSR